MNEKVLSILIKAEDNASKVMSRVGDNVSNAGAKIASAAGAMAKATALAGAAALAAGTVIGFNFNNSVEQAQVKLMAFMKDGNKVAQTLEWVKDEAAKTQFSFVDMADAAGNLTPVANSTGVALKDLIKQAEILAAVNPEQGLTGATFALREALTGDWVSIIDRFNLPRQRINQLKAEGVPAMEIISRTMREMGIDYDLVSKQGETTSARWNQITDQMGMLAGKMTEPLFQGASKGLSIVNDWFTKNQASIQKFATVVGTNLKAAIDAVVTVFNKWMEIMKPVFDYISGNTKVMEILGVALQVVLGIIGALIVVIATTLVAAFAALVFVIQSVSNVIDFLIDTFISLGNTAGAIVNNVVSFFSQLPERIGNAIAGIKNAVLGAFNGAGSWLVGVGKNLLDGLISALSGAGAMIRKAIGDIDIPGPLGKIRDTIPGFATGGYTGAGGRNEVAGIVHKGEYVVPKSGVDQSTGLPKASGTNVTINMLGTTNMNSQSDIETLARRISDMLNSKNELGGLGVGI